MISQGLSMLVIGFGLKIKIKPIVTESRATKLIGLGTRFGLEYLKTYAMDLGLMIGQNRPKLAHTHHYPNDMDPLNSTPSRSDSLEVTFLSILYSFL